MRKKGLLRASALVLCIALAAQSIGSAAVAGDENTDGSATSVTDMDEYVYLKNDEIPVSSIIIGSYVIHINGLTDAVYSQAEETMNTFSQYNKYYKSELADGQWFDITGATSLSDITSSAAPVDASVIEALEFTHMVSETGEVTDLRNGYTVSIYDITSPYSLMDLEELEPLNWQYELLRDKEGKTESDNAVMYMLEQFYKSDIQTDETKKYDDIIAGLEKYRNTLSDRGKPATWIDEVQKVMKHVDALRRVEAFNILSDNLNELLDSVGGQGGETYYYDDSEKKQTVSEYYVNTDMSRAIGEALSKVEESISNYQAKMLTEGTTSSSQSRYKYSNDLMDTVSVTTHTETYYEPEYVNWWSWWWRPWTTSWLRVRSTVIKNITYDEAKADEATQRLVDCTNIVRDTIVDVTSEADTAKEMSENAALEYRKKLAEGVNDTYKNAVSQGASLSERAQYLQAQKKTTDEARLEYQSLLQAWFDRMSNTALQLVIEEQLNKISELEALPPADDVQKYQLDTVSDHESWLRQKLSQAINNSSDTTQMDKLSKELDSLNEAKQTALDNNDLAEAKRIEADIEAKQTDIDNLMSDLEKIIASDSSTSAQKARAAAQLGENNTASVINNLAEEIKAAIRDSSSDGVGDSTGETPGGNTGDSTGETPGGNTGDNTGETPGGNTGDNTGETPGGNTGDNTGETPGGNTGDNTGETPGESTGDNTEETSGENTGDNTGETPGENTGDNTEETSEESTEDNTGETPEENTGDNTGETPEESTEDNTGETPEESTEDNTGETPGGNTGGNTGETPGGNTGDNTEETPGGNTGDNTKVNPGTLTSSDKVLLNKIDALSALAELNPEAGDAAFSDIEDAISNASALKPVLSNALNYSVADARRRIDAALNRNVSNVSGLQLTALIEDILGSSLEDASSLELSGVVLALTRFGYDYDNVNARNLAISLAGDMYNSGNIYMYLKYRSDVREFVSLKAAGAVLGYRYVFDDIHCTVTLSKGRKYKTFKKDSDSYQYTGEKTGKLDNSTVFQDTLYLSDADAGKQYNVNAGYVHGSDYAVVVTTAVDALAKQIYDQLEEQLR